MKSFRFAVIAGLGLLAASVAPGVAAAANGYVTADLNERAGPGVEFPRIAVIPAGSPVTIYGCLAEVPWCDVSWYGYRGWVSAYYLQSVYSGNRVGVRYYRQQLGIPHVSFSIAIYWGNHYRAHPFYDDSPLWNSWQPVWAAPAPGPGPRPYIAWTDPASKQVVYTSPQNPRVTGKRRPGYVAASAPQAKKVFAAAPKAKKIAMVKKKTVVKKSVVRKAKVTTLVVKKKPIKKKVVRTTKGSAPVTVRKGGPPLKKCVIRDGRRICPPPEK